MNKNIKIILWIVILAIIFGIIVFSKKGDDVKVVEENTVNEEQIVEEEDMMVEKEKVASESAPIVMQAGVYEAYSAEKLARAESGDVVLFFHASWCPYCRALDTDIEKNLNNIPENVSILKVDYDKEADLKKKYGVTYQHTFVQVDKDGNMIKKWSGSATLARLLAEIK